MRISDWSSDVCSSDLVKIIPSRFCRGGAISSRMSGGTLGRSAIIVLERAYFKITCIYRKNRLRHRQRCGSGGIVGQFLLQRGGADGFGIEQALPPFGRVEDQIGRASCRERMGRDV